MFVNEKTNTTKTSNKKKTAQVVPYFLIFLAPQTQSSDYITQKVGFCHAQTGFSSVSTSLSLQFIDAIHRIIAQTPKKAHTEHRN
jgi:hypothetical protein